MAEFIFWLEWEIFLYHFAYIPTKANVEYKSQMLENGEKKPKMFNLL